MNGVTHGPRWAGPSGRGGSHRDEERVTLLHILGMRDNACRERMIAALESVEGVLDVAVSLHRAQAMVRHDGRCSRDCLVSVVQGAGYVVFE